MCLHCLYCWFWQSTKLECNKKNEMMLTHIIRLCFVGGIVLNWNCFGTELNLFWVIVSILPYMKRPAAELVRAVNKFKADFGGHVVSLERVQPSSDHVPHRCVLFYFSWILFLKWFFFCQSIGTPFFIKYIFFSK